MKTPEPWAISPPRPRPRLPSEPGKGPLPATPFVPPKAPHPEKVQFTTATAPVLYNPPPMPFPPLPPLPAVKPLIAFESPPLPPSPPATVLLKKVQFRNVPLPRLKIPPPKLSGPRGPFAPLPVDASVPPAVLLPLWAELPTKVQFTALTFCPL